jgi:allantoin racemase
MRHVLILNPNTRAELTDRLVSHARAQAQVWTATGPKHRTAPMFIGATAPFGADYIADERSYVVAAHAVLDAWHSHVLAHGRPQAVLVACFGDPGVWALREVAGVPVMGLAEAAMREADALGAFGIVTGGTAWGPMLERLARALQLGGPAHLRSVHTVAASGGEMVANEARALADLAQACQQLLADDAQSPHAPGVSSLILGGAALAGWAERLRPSPGVPVIDSMAAGVRWLLAQP